MQAGDFTALAADYARYRPDYSATVLQALLRYTGATRPGFYGADVGAGTGIWTRMLAEQGLCCTAIEPNDAMREQGMLYTSDTTVRWVKGCAENTGLETGSIDWVTMASSFHWTTLPDTLQEFARILKPGGFLTVLWNPRAIEGNLLHQRIEEIIYALVPDLTRVSSGAAQHARDYGTELTSTGDFAEVVFFEARHEIVMSQQRYLGIWRSVNDIQRQAGPERFAQILDAIAAEIAPLSEIVVPYKTRAWTAVRGR